MKELDLDHSGTLPFADFKASFGKAGVPRTEHEYKVMFRLVEKDSNKRVYYGKL